MPKLIRQGGLLLIGSDFYNPSIMYMGGACETWKWAKSWMWEILLQGQVPSMGVADPTTQTHENSQSQH
jgi:hypothetical protein